MKNNPSNNGAAKPEPKKGRAAQPTAVLHHLYNKETDDHYYTTSTTTKDEKLDDSYSYVTAEGKLFAKQVSGTIGLYTDNGLVGYMYEKEQKGTRPLYYLRGPGQKAKGDWYTTSLDQKADAEEQGWIYLGIVGYVG